MVDRVARRALRSTLLVGAGFAEQAIDRREDFRGLFANAFALGLIGDLAGEIDGLPVDDRLRHPRAGVQSFNAHRIRSFEGGVKRARCPERAEEVAFADLDPGARRMS